MSVPGTGACKADHASHQELWPGPPNHQIGVAMGTVGGVFFSLAQ